MNAPPPSAAVLPAINLLASPQALPRIPTPPRHRWRIFCAEALPFLIFGACAVGVGGLWRHAAAKPTLVAEAEIVRTDVKALQAGIVSGLEVQLLQPVAAGDIIARVQITDPKVLAASLAVSRSEIDLLRAGLEPTIAPRRVALDSARLQLDWMRERVTLASLRVQLQQAEMELARLAPLHERSMVSGEVFDAARLLRDRFTAERDEQQKLVDSLAGAFDTKAPTTDTADLLTIALRAQEEKLRLTEAQLSPITITAPIAGAVTAIACANGATVVAGDIIVTITEQQSKRLVGFLRQPLPATARVGQPVELRTRSLADSRAQSTIAEIGHALEPVSPTVLALFNRANVPELGLRVHIPIPTGFVVRPGEQVDVVISGL